MPRTRLESIAARAGSILAVAGLLAAVPLSEGAAQDIAIPNQQYESLSFLLQSLGDNITLYMGDPQQLLLMKVRPDRFRPRVEFTPQAQAVLRVHDLDLDEKPAAGAAEGKGTMTNQTLEIRLCPTAPTSFAVQCDQGTSSLDFTDMMVRSVDIQAKGTQLQVSFSRPNEVEMDKFVVRVPDGSFQFSGMLNARAKEMAFLITKSACELELTGKEFEGESAVTILGVPSSLRWTVSRKVGVRVGGPAATIASFKAPHMNQDGDTWVSRDFDKAKCRVKLTFSDEIPGLAVGWK